jgi:uncharacterized membrane protein
MRSNLVIIFSAFLITMNFPEGLMAQSWEFAKEKEGIRVYTMKADDKPLKAYKGITDIDAPAEKVFALIENVNNTDWWDKNLSQIKVLGYEKNKFAKYHLIFDMPWPVSDRELFVDAEVTIDPATGIRKITAVPLRVNTQPSKDRIRINEYRQTWTVKPVSSNLTQVTLEGYVNPGGSLPAWIINMFIVDAPMNSIGEIKKRMSVK